MKKDTIYLTKIYNEFILKFDKDGIMPKTIEIIPQNSYKEQQGCYSQAFFYDTKRPYIKIDLRLLNEDNLYPILFHEFTHIYDYVYFSANYNEEEIKTIMSSYSEFHAQKIATFTYLQYKDVKYSLSEIFKMKETSIKLEDYLNFQYNKYKNLLENYNNFTYKNCMYLCGEISAYKIIFRDEIDSLINTNIIPREIRDSVKILCDTFDRFGVHKELFKQIDELHKSINDIILKRIQVNFINNFFKLK